MAPMATFAQKVKLQMILICLGRLLPMSVEKCLPPRELIRRPALRHEAQTRLPFVGLPLAFLVSTLLRHSNRLQIRRADQTYSARGPEVHRAPCHGGADCFRRESLSARPRGESPTDFGHTAERRFDVSFVIGEADLPHVPEQPRPDFFGREGLAADVTRDFRIRPHRG